jgi:hypothetical protein
MSIYTKLHIRALTDLVEFMSIVSTIAIGIDLYWCVSDFIEQAYTIRLIPMIIGLSFCLIGMCIAVNKYHWKLVSQIAGEIKLEKVLRRRNTQISE